MNPYLQPLRNTEDMRANEYKGCTPSDSDSDSDLWASGSCGNCWSKLKATSN